MLALHAVSGAADRAGLPAHPGGGLDFLRRRRDLDRNARLTAGLFIVFILAAALFHIAERRRALAARLRRPGRAQGAHGGRGAGHRRRLLAPDPRAPGAALAAATSPAPTWRSSRPTPRSRPPSPGAPTSSSAPTQRFEQALSRSNITVYTQDTDLRLHLDPQPPPRPDRGGDDRPAQPGLPARGRRRRVVAAEAAGARQRADHQRHRRDGDAERGHALPRHDGQPHRRPARARSTACSAPRST